MYRVRPRTLAILISGCFALALSVILAVPWIQELADIGSLDHQDEKIRKNAAARLARRGSIKAIPKLIELLVRDTESRSGPVRSGGSPISPISPVLDTNSHYCAEALIAIGMPALPRIVDLFEHDDRTVRLVVYSIVIGIGAPALPRMLDELKSDNALRVLGACYVLSWIDEASEEVLPYLRKIEQSEHSEIAEMARSTMWSINARSRQDRVLNPGESQLAILLRRVGDPGGPIDGVTHRKILELGESANEELVFILKTGDAVLRRRAADYLAFINYKSKSVSDELVVGLIRALSDGEKAVRLAAINALGAIGRGARQAIPHLRELREETDTEIRRAAESSLVLLEL